MTTDGSPYRLLFHYLIQHMESEVVQFKKAENNFDFDDCVPSVVLMRLSAYLGIANNANTANTTPVERALMFGIA